MILRVHDSTGPGESTSFDYITFVRDIPLQSREYWVEKQDTRQKGSFKDTANTVANDFLKHTGKKQP
jgi:hypothetical protein